MTKENLYGLRGIYEVAFSELYGTGISLLHNGDAIGEVLVITYVQIFTVITYNEKAVFIASQLRGALIDNCGVYNDGQQQCTRFNTTKKVLKSFLSNSETAAIDILTPEALQVFKKLYTKNLPVEQLMGELKLKRKAVYDLYRQGEKTACFLLAGLGSALNTTSKT